MTRIDRILNGRGAINVLHEQGLSLNDYDETKDDSINPHAGGFYASSFFQTKSSTKEECIAKYLLLMHVPVEATK